MKSYAVLIEPWAVYIKKWAFFKAQGGLVQKWGKRWRKMRAHSIEDARNRGWRNRHCDIKD